ncbi:40844_t:CDS:2, partial [Gigaspora margarita]
MPLLGINSIIVGTTTQTTKTVRDDLALDFYVEERIREKEPQVFGYQQGKTSCTPRGATPRTPRTPRNKRTTLSSMNPTSTLTLSLVLETNPIPNMSDQQSSQN